MKKPHEKPYERLKQEDELVKFDIHDASPDPFIQFRLWYDAAQQADPVYFNAMALSTADLTGKPSSRMVLLKQYDKDGFIFFSNFHSAKGRDIEANPNVSLLFFWKDFERQVRLEGKVVKIEPSLSDEYFATRPREFQVSSHASPQSERVPDRDFLETRYKEYLNDFIGKKVPRPDNWGGYRLIPEYFEFWQGRVNRLHDRLSYSKEGEAWRIERLAP